MNNECKYCNKQFSNKFTLKNHQNNAKYCLELRKQDNNNFQCVYCKKTLASKWSLENHYDSCIDKFKIELKQRDKEIISYKEYINKLELQNKDLLHEIKDLAKFALDKPTYDQRNTTTNKTIDNRVLNMVPMDITEDRLLKVLQEKFTENHLMKGQKGLAEFCLENNILINQEGKFLMKCTDPSRKIFVYLDEEGKLQKDVNADRLTKMLNEPVKEVTKRLYDDIRDQYFDNQNFNEEIEEEAKEDPDEERLNYATAKVIEITSLKKNNSEFVKNLIPPLTTS